MGGLRCHYNRPVISIRRLFQHPAIPREYRGNFTHLYLDIGWFGVLSGSAINFLNVYAARLGATGVQIGLLAAMSAVVTLIFAIPSAHWLEKRPFTKAVFWTSVYYRLGFLLWIPLPWLFDNQGQIWALIGLALFMGIPLTALSVGFNALFAEAVPSEWRAYVAGIRNVVLSITFILTSLGSGYLLDRLPFPIGYQIVFGIGFFGAAMSSFHLYFVKPLPQGDSKTDTVTIQPVAKTERPSPRLTWHTANECYAAIRADIWQTPFRSPLLVMFGFHLAQFLAIPLFPLYFVHILNLTDEQIGIGTSLFYLTVLIGSTQLNRIVRRIGHHKLTGFGAIGLSLYPGLLSLSQNVAAYYLVSAVGGFSWAMVGGAYANYLLEKIPASDRPAHLAWYNLILNAAVLIGSLAGPALAASIGLNTALILFAVLRLLSGLAILKWG